MVVMDKQLASTAIKDYVIEPIRNDRMEVVLYDEVTPEPSPKLADDGAEIARREKVQLVVGVGGGSSMDVAKAVAVLSKNPGKATDYIGLDLVKTKGLPTIMVPTTAGTGSETTFTAVFTMREKKTKGGINSPFLYSDIALLDPELTLDLPPHVTAYTGMDALTHAIESFTSIKSNEVSDLFSFRAIELIGRNLRPAVFQGTRIEAREAMLLASYLAGVGLANAGVTAVHALAYPLGALFDVPHGIANGTLLPYVMRYNAPAAVEKFTLVAQALGVQTYGLSPREACEMSADAVFRLAEDIGMPANLSEIGIPEIAFEEMARGAMNISRPMENNPRPMNVDTARALYTSAYGS
jgi:alcohol dehydrogenase